jgi:para-nitrobenzyl esterase
VDGTTIPAPPLDLIHDGAARDVAIVVGSNRDEWMLFDTFLGHASTQLVVAQVRERLGAPLMDRLHASYRSARGSADARAWVDLIGDMAFLIPAIQLAEAHAPHAPVYMYRFDFGTPMLGAAHALELPFVWNVLDGSFAQLLLGADAAAALPLAAAMHGAWAAFIRTGTPDATPAWPTYDLERRATLLFDRSITVAGDPDRELREMWRSILAPLRR